MDLRFLKKILTDIEIEKVRGCENPDALLWSIWACKEAAYKVLKKQTDDAVFIPRRWSVHFRKPLPLAEAQGIGFSKRFLQIHPPAEFYAGDVMIEGKNAFPFYLFSSLFYVHSLVADRFDVLDKAIWRIEILPEGRAQEDRDPSSFGRSCLIHDLSEFLRVDPHQVEIRRVSRNERELLPPTVYLQGVPAANVDISLSHDGQLVSYAFVSL